MERVLVREREMTEAQQHLKLKVETLSDELSEERRRCAELEAAEEERTRHVRAPEDVEAIALLEEQLAAARGEVGYLRQELIEARARKSASDDELGTFKGKAETLQNTVSSLSEEGE